ncbi:MAG TPA: Nramp family divalent metal transporter [Gemmatimonadaceae bacterium]|nr:Nramp family divalent metal transporter [Gemmatimonadaceae bacterium]
MTSRDSGRFRLPAEEPFEHDGEMATSEVRRPGREGWRVVAIARLRAVEPVGMARRFLDGLGPGLIAGAADDDPSGISTYSTAGAAFGFATLWTAVFSFPLMSAVQLMCARIGMVSGRGLASVLRRYYTRRLLWFALALLLVANTVNIAADLGGMADVTAMLVGTDSLWYEPAYTLLILAVLVFSSYRAIVRIFKWLTLVLFAYVIAAFLARPDWSAVLRDTLVPHVSLTREYLMTLVAIFGTTISPYLFFWQASQAVEVDRAAGKLTTLSRMGATDGELRAARTDVLTGMFFSNFVRYFIILTTGATLHASGQTEIATATQAAAALKPLAGHGASLLFALGLIGTGLLGVPVLAGSVAYAVAEAGGWRMGMDERPLKARRFYTVLGIAMLGGMAMDFANLDAIKMLFWSAVLNGLLAPPLIVIILFVCNNPVVMGERVNGRWLNVLGTATAVVMGAAGLGLLYTFLH